MKDCPKEKDKCRHYCIICHCCACLCNVGIHRVFNKKLVFSDYYQINPEIKCQCTGCKIDRKQAEEIKESEHVFEEGKTPVAHGLATLVANKIFEDERLEQVIYKACYKIAKAVKEGFEGK